MDAGPILDILRERGPLTGKELRDAARADELELWRACRSCPEIRESRIGRRYLRLDRQVDGYARLSPSIKREFLTYAVFGLEADDDAREEKAKALSRVAKDISLEKITLAQERIANLLAVSPHLSEALTDACYIIAGDVVYGMAHREPRPESSTGKIVSGSDLDVIVVVRDGFSHEMRRELDRLILSEKYRLLIDPEHREELDYLIKDISKVKEQLAFDTFPHMIAGKILDEGQYLYGSRDLYQEVRALVDASGVPEKLREMEQTAIAFREEAERRLLVDSDDLPKQECWKLFYTSAEQDEIF